MGKRELLLIVAFLIVGAVVYQATAPPPGPNERSVSLSGILAKVKREMRGNRASAEETRVTTHEVDAALTEIRISGGYVELTITGEDRKNVEARFRVTSSGYDDDEAKQLVQQTHRMFKVDRAGPVLRMTSDYPGPARQTARLTLLVPQRLGVKVEGGAPRTAISNVAVLEMSGVRGETSLKKIAGRVTVTHRGGRLVIDDVAALKLTVRGGDTTLSKVRGDASISVISGELTASGLAGPIDVDAQGGAEVVLKNLDDTRGPLRVNAVGGSVRLEGLQGDARVDGRGTEIDVAMTKPAAVAVYNEGDEPIDITPPPGGFVLDARVTDGRLSVPDDLRAQLTSTGGDEDKERRATGAVRGGGPTLTLRANRGDITIRAREAAKPERAAPNPSR
jgi:hypothetical protein